MFSKKNKETPPLHFRQAFEAIDLPETWEELDGAALCTLALLRLMRYGKTEDFADQPALKHLYGIMMSKLSSQERLQLEQAVCGFAMRGETGFLALLPFLLGDTETSVISSATIDYAMLMPRENGDLLTGPHFLIRRYEESAGNDARRLGILTGLILLGDERLLPLVKGRWRDFASPEDRCRLAAAKSGFISTLLIEFLLDWLESTNDESDIGAIAGAMARMPLDDQVGFVIRQRRCFPASDAEAGEVIQCLEKWSFAEYAKRIRPRLEPLIAKESLPKVIPAILERWQVSE